MNSYLTVAQVAERAQLCDRTVRRAIQAGRLRAFLVGREYRVRVEDAVAWIEACPVEVAVPVARRRVVRARPVRGSFRALMEIDREAKRA